MDKCLSIVDPRNISTYEFHVVPAAVAIIKGYPFNNLEEYIHAGFGQGGDSCTDGERVTISGIDALHSHCRTASWPFNTQEDAPFEQYDIVRNRLSFQIDLKTDDPFRDEFLRSFNFF